MKPTLKHKPSEYSYKDILISFANSKPLACDQLNFIYRHEHALSSHGLDPVLKYYLKRPHPKQPDQHASQHNFLIHHDIFSAPVIHELKRRLHIFLQDQGAHVELTMSPSQFQQFQQLTEQELVLYHGNLTLTGAPSVPGGTPRLVYFQWGNLFGVAKMLILAEEKALESNLLIHFEMMYERTIDQCVKDYELRLTDELLTEDKLRLQHEMPYQHHHLIYQIPSLRYAININNEKDE